MRTNISVRFGAGIEIPRSSPAKAMFFFELLKFNRRGAKRAHNQYKVKSRIFLFFLRLFGHVTAL